MRNGLEHAQTSAAGGVKHAGGSLIARQQIAQSAQAVLRASDDHSGIPIPDDDEIVHVRVLRDIQRRQMEAERAHAAYESPDQEIAGVPSAVGGETVGGQLNVREQFVRALIRVRPPS